MRRQTAWITRAATFLAAVFVITAAASSARADDSGARRAAARARRAEGEGRAPDAAQERRTDHVRIGPLVGIGFPRPFAIEAFGKIEKLVGVGVEYSFLPELTVSDVNASFRAIALDARVFPFKGAFFIGVRAGRQWLDARTSVDVGRYGSFRESMAAETWFFNPRIGFLYTFGSGITVGADAGVQLPISPSYERRGALTEAGFTSGSEVDQVLASAAATLGNKTTVTVDLLRLGFLF